MSDGRDDTGFEERITEMLHRRARDIPDDPAGTTRPIPAARSRPADGDRRIGGTQSRRWLAAAAAALLVTGGGATVWALAGRGTDDAGPAARVETGVLDDDDGSVTGREERVQEGGGSGTARDPADPAGPTSLDDVLASLPTGLDLHQGSTIQLDGPPTDDPQRAARDYMTDRLPGLDVGLAPVDDDELLHLYRWTAEQPDRPGSARTAGWLIVRLGPGGAGVAAATTDGVEVTSLTRSEGAVSASVSSRLDGRFLADVTDLHGQPVAEAATPAQPGDAARRLGTAGSADGPGEIGLETDVPPWPVSLRVQHVDDTWRTITELVLQPVGFSRSCGAEPPVRIEVGDRLGRLAPGSLPGSQPPWPNQTVWHHAATEASKQTAVEIRWPPDPTLIGRFALASLGSDLTATVTTGVSADPALRTRLATAETHAIVAISGDGASDPCALVQMTVRGDPETAEWWAGALAAEWSFDLPLTLATADLDPLATIDDDAPAASELVVATHEGVAPADVPRVPVAGSCDGLPDDPPRTGPVPGTVFSEPVEALGDFIATGDVDPGPPLPPTGYEEYRLTTGDDLRIYVNRDDRLVLTVIEIERADGGGWRVTGWEAAVC